MPMKRGFDDNVDNHWRQIMTSDVLVRPMQIILLNMFLYFQYYWP